MNFVEKVMSLLYNMLSRFVIALLPGSKHLKYDTNEFIYKTETDSGTQRTDL